MGHRIIFLSLAADHLSHLWGSHVEEYWSKGIEKSLLRSCEVAEGDPFHFSLQELVHFSSTSQGFCQSLLMKGVAPQILDNPLSNYFFGGKSIENLQNYLHPPILALHPHKMKILAKSLYEYTQNIFWRVESSLILFCFLTHDRSASILRTKVYVQALFVYKLWLRYESLLIRHVSVFFMKQIALLFPRSKDVKRVPSLDMSFYQTQSNIHIHTKGRNELVIFVIG